LSRFASLRARTGVSILLAVLAAGAAVLFLAGRPPAPVPGQAPPGPEPGSDIASRAAAPPGAPDVVLVILESASPTALAGQPQLRRLAARGRSFERAFAQYPAAGASRTSLLTGWRPDRTGVWGEPSDRVPGARPLPEHFAASGYVTTRLGRVYAGPGEATLRWDRAEDPGPGHVGARAAALLAGPSERPRFLALNLGSAPAPGAAIAAPPPAPEGRRVASDLPAIAAAPLHPFARPGAWVRPPALGASERQRRADDARSRAQVVDAELGPVLDALEREGAWERTIVVVVGDVAPDLGGHGALPRPDVLFEEALRVPLVIAAPQAGSPGTPSESLAELVDVYPTLVDLAGIAPVEGLDGLSLRSVLADPGSRVKEAAVSVLAREAGQIGRSVRTSRWRYTEWPDGSRELYDHESDPHEFRNRAGDPAAARAEVDLGRLMEGRYQGTTPGGAAPGGPRRNVVLIVADDLNARIGAHGYPVRTPQIDRLAGRGRAFARAYAQVPSCSPSRSSLLSGWKPERTDIWNNLTPVRQHLQGAQPLQEYFHAQGYYTARLGKIYEAAMADQFDWDFDDVAEAEADDPRGDDDEGPRGAWWQPTDHDDAAEPDGARARRAARLLEEHTGKGRPLFLAVGFSKPHLKWVAPRRYFDLYPPGTLTPVEAPADDLADIPAIAIKNRPQERPGVPLLGREPPGLWPDPKFRRDAIAAYSAATSFMDAQVGVILDALDRLHLWDDTVVVLVGDHGFHLGEHHGLWRKDTLFEEALRVPLVVAAPGIGRPGTPSRAPVELLDVYPTLVELAGVPPVAGLDGASLSPLLRDPAAPWRPAALSFRKAKAPPLAVSVRTERYRYTQWPDGTEELYDHATDPAETRNLAGDPGARAALQDMRGRRASGPGSRP
jgi:uncharacterized sulfatase